MIVGARGNSIARVLNILFRTICINLSLPFSNSNEIINRAARTYYHYDTYSHVARRYNRFDIHIVAQNKRMKFQFYAINSLAFIMTCIRSRRRGGSVIKNYIIRAGFFENDNNNKTMYPRGNLFTFRRLHLNVIEFHR